MFSKGDFVLHQLIDSDKKKVKYIGLVVSSSVMKTTYEASDGKVNFTATVPTSELKISSEKPHKVKTETIKSTKIKIPMGFENVKAATGGTKFERAVKLYKEIQSSNPSRQTLIALFVEKLGMTPAGASTYASTVKKA